MITQKEFQLIGLKVRTSNTIEATAQGEIPKLWTKLFAENVKAQIPDASGDEIYAVYCNYESNEKGSYDFFLGYKVSGLSSVPAGLHEQTIQAGNYKKLETSRGAVFQVVPEIWFKIWKMTAAEFGGERVFQTDFEVYGSRAQNPNDAVVEVYLGIK